MPQSADHVTVLLEQIVTFLAESKTSYDEKAQRMESKIDEITTSVNQQLSVMNDSLSRLDQEFRQINKNFDPKRLEMMIKLLCKRIEGRLERLQDVTKATLTRYVRLCI